MHVKFELLPGAEQKTSNVDGGKLLTSLSILLDPCCSSIVSLLLSVAVVLDLLLLLLLVAVEVIVVLVIVLRI